MSRGKRQAETEEFDWEQIPYKKIAIILIIVALLIILSVFAVHMKDKSKGKEEDNTTAQKEVQDSMPAEYEGYSVLGQLVIEKINLEQYIVDSKEDNAMAKAPAKLYGADVNSRGNICIAGHNYDEVFAKLNELVVGDKFYIIDREETKMVYEVKEVKEIEPTDLTALMPVQDKIQVTLITCIDGATKRLAVVAEQIESE